MSVVQGPEWWLHSHHEQEVLSGDGDFPAPRISSASSDTNLASNLFRPANVSTAMEASEKSFEPIWNLKLPGLSETVSDEGRMLPPMVVSASASGSRPTSFASSNPAPASVVFSQLFSHLRAQEVGEARRGSVGDFTTSESEESEVQAASIEPNAPASQIASMITGVTVPTTAGGIGSISTISNRGEEANRSILDLQGEVERPAPTPLPFEEVGATSNSLFLRPNSPSRRTEFGTVVNRDNTVNNPSSNPGTFINFSI